MVYVAVGAICHHFNQNKLPLSPKRSVFLHGLWSGILLAAPEFDVACRV